jgi:CxxC motif-containing protein (DUF1111 family)
MNMFATASLLLPASWLVVACSPSQDGTRLDPSDDPDVTVAVSAEGAPVHSAPITEAPTGFDNKTNGFCTQADMDAAQLVFEQLAGFADGLGPCYNLTSCVGCHQNPFFQDATGGQVSELRAGNFDGTSFTDHPGGSLIQDRAIDRSIQEHILSGNNVAAFRTTLSAVGDGYVEAIDSNTLVAISNAQPAAQRGTVIQVPVLEAAGTLRVARFGWKNQNASLLTTSGDEYINQIGITNRLFRRENTCNGIVVEGGVFDGNPVEPGGVEDTANDIDAFTQFIRCTKAPPRGPITAQVTSGQTLFTQIGCAVCHVATITTVPAGTIINGGAFTVPAALGDKNIHPFGDYLLHDIGTGDGIVQNGGPATRNMVRTAALWGIGARTRLMHDGASVRITDAIARHANQAATARANFGSLSAANQASVLAFISSL